MIQRQWPGQSHPAVRGHRSVATIRHDVRCTMARRTTAHALRLRGFRLRLDSINNLPAYVETQYGLEGAAHVLTAPDGTIYKEFMAQAGKRD